MNTAAIDLIGSSKSDAGITPVLVTPETASLATKDLPLHMSLVINVLTKLEKGSLTISYPDGRWFRFDSGEQGPNAVVQLNNWKLASRAISSGTIGVAESYMDGDWDSPDVTTFLELFCANMEIGNRFSTPKWLSNVIAAIRHWFNENNKRGSRAQHLSPLRSGK